MRMFVTGVAGFVGSTLAERLLRDGHDVIGLDCFTSYYSRALKFENLQKCRENPRFRFIEADLVDCDISSLLRGVDVIFHQAGQPGVRASWGTEFNTYVGLNVLATQRLLDAALNLDGAISRIVYASSSSVYGNAKVYPVVEDAVPQPRSPYGVTKLAAEHLCSLYADNFGLPTVSLRYFTVYGPRQRPDMAFTRFLCAIRDGDELSIYGDGSQIRDFTYVDDIVEANVLAAVSDLNSGSVFNIAGGSSVSLKEAVGIMGDLAHTTPLLQFGVPVAGDVLQTGGDSRLFRESTGWAPRVNLETGLQRQFEYLTGKEPV